jgi:aminoglycoside phosphotransferase (APT) family kinase protein
LEGINEELVTAWFTDNVAGAVPPLTFSLISGGKSNLTYQLNDATGKAYVLRRPPLGHVLESAHDMNREHRIISALQNSGVPVAKTYGMCRDKDVNGADFFVMECIEGTVLHDADAAESMTADERRSFGKDVADVLVKLHLIEPDDVGLGDLAKREAFLDRQLKRWTGQWEATKTHEEPEMDELLIQLHQNKPEQVGSAIVHGDYRPGNFMHKDGKVAAIFDWELCTLGDPLADVGYLLNSWQRPEDIEEMSGESAPTGVGGFPSRQEMSDRYSQGTGRDLSQINYYRAFSHWRLACIAQGVYKRFLEGVMGVQEMDVEIYRTRIGYMANEALKLLHDT